MTKTIENGVTVLTASEGMKLTNGSSVGSVVRLGKEANEAEWYEITNEEAEEIINRDPSDPSDPSNPDEATAEDYQSALREMGVKV